MKKIFNKKTFEVVKFSGSKENNQYWRGERLKKTIIYLLGIPIWVKRDNIQKAVILDGLVFRR